MTLYELWQRLVAKAQQFTLWGTPAPSRRHNPNLQREQRVVTRDGKTFTQTFYVRRTRAPTKPTPPAQARVVQPSLFAAPTAPHTERPPARPKAQKAPPADTIQPSRLFAAPTAPHTERPPADTIQPSREQFGAPERAVARLIEQLGIGAHLATQDDVHLRLPNDPWLPLVIEKRGDKLHLTHYIKDHAGDTQPDGEMVFTIQNGYLKLQATAVMGPRGELRGHDRSFATMFARNLIRQGFGTVERARWEGKSAAALRGDGAPTPPEGDASGGPDAITPRVGDTKVENGITYRLNENHRWERVDDPEAGRLEGQVAALEADGEATPAVRPQILVGLPEGATPAQRRAWNREALALLDRLRSEGRTANDDEKRILGRYSGRGGIGSDLNEFYTPPEIGEAMWRALERLGVREGKGLEPSCGTGVMLQFAPEGVHMTGVELARDSADIAQHVFGDRHTIHQGAFEGYSTGPGADELFDFVIGNPPFGAREDSLALDRPDITEAAEYFTYKTLLHLREGGIAALVLPHGIVSNRGNQARAFRAKLLAHAELVTAHGLPTSAFRRTQTGVATTDVVILRRRNPNAAALLEHAGEEGLIAAGLHNEAFLAGNYFEMHPERKHGRDSRNGLGWYIREGDLTPEVLERLSSDVDLTVAASPSYEEVERALRQAGLYDKAWSRALRNDERKEGKIRVSDSGRLQVCRDGRWHNVEDEQTSRAYADGLRLSEALNLHATLLSNGKVADANALRDQLHRLLQEYLSSHGNPHQHPELQRLMRRSTALNALLAAIDQTGEIAPLYRQDAAEQQRVNRRDLPDIVRHLRRQGELATARNIYAYYDHPDATEEHITRALLEQGYALTPPGWHGREAELVPRGELFVGDARALRDALTAARDASSGVEREAYEAQLAHLAEITPRTPLEEIPLSPRTAWLDKEVVKEYIHDMLRSRGMTLYPFQWDYNIDDLGNITITAVLPGERKKLFDERAFNFLKRYLGNKGRRSDEQQDYDQLDEHFRVWLTENGHRDAVEAAFAERNNAWLEGSFDARDLGEQIEGWNPRVTLHPWQNEAANRCLAQGSGIIALDVGLGKTLASIALTLKAKQDGLARRPLIAVPKSVIGNWREEFQLAKPGVRLFIVGAEPVLDENGNIARDDDGNEVWRDITDAPTLDKQLAQARVGDYDAILMTHTTLGRIPMERNKQLELIEREYGYQKGEAFVRKEGMSDSQWLEYGVLKAQAMLEAGELTLDELADAAQEVRRLDAELDQLNAQKGKDRQAKGDRAAKMERRRRAAFLAKVYSRMQAGSNILTTTWESLGIDHLVVDEAHAFKGLWTLDQKRRNIKYLGAGQDSSQMAIDLYFKTLEMRERNGDRGVYLATATPLKNSPIELYNMLAYAAPGLFKSLGINNINDFVDRFCRIETDYVYNPNTDRDEPCQYLAGLKNLEQLRTYAGRFVNRKTAEAVGLKLPEKRTGQNFIHPTQEQRAVISEIATNPLAAIRRYMGQSAIPQDLSTLQPSQLEQLQRAYKLVPFHLMRRAELDLEMLDPVKYRGYVSPKVERLLGDVEAEIRAGEKVVIFCDAKDMFDPAASLRRGEVVRNPNGYTFHQKLKNLIAQRTGLHPEEIAIANADEAPTAEDRQAISRALRSGRVRVVIGNTATMGQGMNLQTGVRNLFHLDVPWNPAELQQREGRVVRQGNANAYVNNRFYLGTRGLDNYMVDILRGKSNWYDEFWNGTGDTISAPEVSTFNFPPEMLAIQAIDDDAEREAALQAYANKERSDRESAERQRALSEFYKYQRLDSLYHHHVEKYGSKDPKRVREQESLAARLAYERKKLEQHPGMASYVRYLQNPQSVYLHPPTGIAMEVGGRYGAVGNHGYAGFEVVGFDHRTGEVSIKQINPVSGNAEDPPRHLKYLDVLRSELGDYDPAQHYYSTVVARGVSKNEPPRTPEQADVARRALREYFAKGDPRQMVFVKDGDGVAAVPAGELTDAHHILLASDPQAKHAVEEYLNDASAHQDYIQRKRKEFGRPNDSDVQILRSAYFEHGTPHYLNNAQGFNISVDHSRYTDRAFMVKGYVVYLRKGGAHER